MDMGMIDYWAVYGRSPLHRASALSKLLATGLLVSAVILTDSLLELTATYLLVAAGVAVARLPLLRALAISSYPAAFAVLFAASRWSSPAEALLIIGKAITSAAAMVVLVTTTPYPQLFGLLRHLMPALIADALFLTYRAFFVLVALMDDLIVTLRLRGGLSRRRYLHNSRNIAAALGLLLVRAVALSEHLCNVLRLRGYRGRLAASPSGGALSTHDLLPLGGGMLAFAAALGQRSASGCCRYGSYFLLVALLSLAAALLLTARGRHDPELM